jgi:hypothetical protein
MWLGRVHPTKGWQWAIAITVEHPPTSGPAVDLRMRAALDLGWRAFEGYIRIAMLYDEDDRFFELRLPLDMPNWRTRRHGLPSSYYDLITAQREIDNLTKDTKGHVRALLPHALPEQLEWLNDSAAWTRAQHGELRLLLDALKGFGIAPEVIRSLEDWKRKNEYLRSRLTVLRERLIARRRWLYRNLAAWLVDNYREIAFESPLNIAKMLRFRDDDYPLRLARRYHRWSAIGEFVRFLNEAAAKTATILVGIDPTMTTLTCNECGALAGGGPKRILECPNGHTWDQDANAARNLFVKMAGASGSDEISGKERWQKSQIPEILSPVIVRFSRING